MYQHPTGKWPASVDILALGPTNQDYHSAKYTYDPIVPETCEVWTLNKGIRTQKFNCCFILDDLIGEGRRSERYKAAIQKTEQPVITSIIDRDVTAMYPKNDLHEFPLWEVIDLWGELHLRAAKVQKERYRRIIENSQNDFHNTAFQMIPVSFSPDDWTPADRRRAGKECAYYMHNSIPMILGYAGFIGVQTIHLWGADYDFPGSNVHEDKKPNAEYWAGMLRAGLGVNIRLSSRSTFLDSNEGLWVYGYGKRQPWEPPCVSVSSQT